MLIPAVATFVCLAGTRLGSRQRALIGWFGIRGFGSIYYLAYALSHGVHGEQARQMADFTVSAVAMSILIHGITSQSLMGWYERRKKRAMW
ncbi:MAG: hypothetical protein WDO56_16705 [Gammaproteobacteria bacterium]